MLEYSAEAIKANPVNMRFLRYLYNMYKESHGISITFEDFLEYRDDILLCTDSYHAYNKCNISIPLLYAFLGCKRINASDIDDEQLKFHCMPHRISYCADIIFFDNSMINDPDDYCDIFEMLIRANEITKRDAFMIVKLPEEYKNILESRLLSIGFYPSTLNENGIYTYFKSPIII